MMRSVQWIDINNFRYKQDRTASSFYKGDTHTIDHHLVLVQLRCESPSLATAAASVAVAVEKLPAEVN